MNEQIPPPKGAPLFNPMSREFIADPYPFYHRLRAADPMHLTPIGLYVATGMPTSSRSFATSASARISSAA